MGTIVTTALLAVDFFALSIQPQAITSKDVTDPSGQIKAEFGDLTKLLTEVTGDLEEIVYVANGVPSQGKTHLTGHAEETHEFNNLKGVLDAILQKLSVAKDTIMNFILPKVVELGDVVAQLEFNATIFLAHCQEEYDKVVSDLALCNKLLSDNATKIIIESHFPEGTV